jgi:hypothetical protein
MRRSTDLARHQFTPPRHVRRGDGNGWMLISLVEVPNGSSAGPGATPPKDTRFPA